jgi:transcriptional regulator with XRE-family HTH domain
MATPKKFSGSNLRKLRLQNGWTQAELAERAGIRRERQIIRWENDQNEPRIETAVGLADALGVTVDELFASLEQEAALSGDPFPGSRGAATSGDRGKRRGRPGEEMKAA